MAPRRYTKFLKCTECANHTLCDPSDGICEECHRRIRQRNRYRNSIDANCEITEALVLDWAKARNILAQSSSKDQAVKLLEEYHELREAIATNDLEGIKDAIGDMMVVQTIIAKFNNLSLRECFNHAYQQIKDRKGKMVDGVFVKEA